jgi:predicted PurR-regulated permease PerM
MCPAPPVRGTELASAVRTPRDWPPPSTLTPPLRDFAFKIAVAIGLLALALLLWRLMEALLLLFAAGVLAIALTSLTRALERITPLRRAWALGATAAGLLIALAAFFALIGWRIADQVGPLTHAIASAWSQLRESLHTTPAGQVVLRILAEAPASVGASLTTGLHAATGTVGLLADVVLVVFIGLFLAADPVLYRRGALRLAPQALRARFAETLDALGAALRRWLAGVLVSMICIGLITGVGLWLLGIPLALSIGFLAGLMEFVPYLGPIASAIPAILIAFARGPVPAVEVLALYILVHVVEAYVLVPLIQRRAVALPPALGLIAVVIFGILFGLPGVIFAHPLMVTVMVLVEKLYLEPSALGE